METQVSLTNNLTTNVAYIDFAKAFDTVRNILLLKAYVISGNVLHWIQSYLTSRTHYVNINCTLSPEENVTSGVSQGSVLSLILFLINVNDLPDKFSPISTVPYSLMMPS